MATPAPVVPGAPSTWKRYEHVSVRVPGAGFSMVLPPDYGEVDPASLKKYGMKKGVKVQPGQPIAEVGRMVLDSMLHFETYPSGTRQNISYKKSNGEGFLKNYFNPTQYLLALATKGK